MSGFRDRTVHTGRHSQLHSTEGKTYKNKCYCQQTAQQTSPTHIHR